MSPGLSPSRCGVRDTGPFVWRAVRDPNGDGLSLMPFLWSGYLPLLLFRHLGGRILLFIRSNVPLLYHQRVKIFDVFLARALLEIFSTLTALLVSFAVFYAIGAVDVPRDLRCSTWVIFT